MEWLRRVAVVGAVARDRGDWAGALAEQRADLGRIAVLVARKFGREDLAGAGIDGQVKFPPGLGAALAAKGVGKSVKVIGTDGLPGPAGGIAAVAKGDWAATFTYPTGANQAIDMAKSILLDCASSVPLVVTVDTTAITAANARQMLQQ